MLQNLIFNTNGSEVGQQLTIDTTVSLLSATSSHESVQSVVILLMAPNSQDDDDFGEEVFTGRVKAATLPMGGPASRRVKKKVEGGPIAQGGHEFNRLKFTRILC